MLEVNDIHSKLNRTLVSQIKSPTSLDELIETIKQVNISGGSCIACSGRHAMGGQQFLEGGTLIDMRKLNRVLSFDVQKGFITVEAGIEWPELIAGYEALQTQADTRWGISQKQTGADRLSLGGAVSANAHGRGLTMSPLGSDIEQLEIVTPDGALKKCSRSENPELFSLVIGGYGLFGCIYSVTLRLTNRKVLRREVRIIDVVDAVPAAQRKIREGFLYGDFQFDIDPDSPSFLTKGVFSGYVPSNEKIDKPQNNIELSYQNWSDLLYLAHVNKREAFTRYAQHYISTDSQLYLSDRHQLSTYVDDYHTTLDQKLGATVVGSEMITELYVPPNSLVDFLLRASLTLVQSNTKVIYGTIRVIDKDNDSFLSWAKEQSACIIFNLHVDHNPQGLENAAIAFRSLIDIALSLGGRFFLTYHRFATKEQLLLAYPELPAFIEKKMTYDSRCIFDSNWFRWLRAILK